MGLWKTRDLLDCSGPRSPERVDSRQLEQRCNQYYPVVRGVVDLGLGKNGKSLASLLDLWDGRLEMTLAMFYQMRIRPVADNTPRSRRVCMGIFQSFESRATSRSVSRSTCRSNIPRSRRYAAPVSWSLYPNSSLPPNRQLCF